MLHSLLRTLAAPLLALTLERRDGATLFAEESWYYTLVGRDAAPLLAEDISCSTPCLDLGEERWCYTLC